MRVLSYLSFIDTFSVMDQEVGFIKFRNYLYNFQQDWIPIMFDEVKSILKKIYEDQEINQMVSSMQTSLNILPHSPASVPNNREYIFKKAETMILLFKNLTDFKYNLDQTEYDQGMEYDDPISYPRGIKNNTKM